MPVLPGVPSVGHVDGVAGDDDGDGDGGAAKGGGGGVGADHAGHLGGRQHPQVGPLEGRLHGRADLGQAAGEDGGGQALADLPREALRSRGEERKEDVYHRF